MPDDTPGDRIWHLVAAYRSWFIPPARTWVDDLTGEAEDYLREAAP